VHYNQRVQTLAESWPFRQNPSIFSNYWKYFAENQQVSVAEIKYSGDTKSRMKSHAGSSPDCLFLIPENSDNQLVVHFLVSFREANIASALVSLTPGLIKSAGDVRVRVDFSIDQLPETTLPRFVHILENRLAASVLLADPRVHQLIARTLANKGRPMILTEPQSLFQAASFSEVMIIPEFEKAAPFLLAEFARQLVSWLADWNFRFCLFQFLRSKYKPSHLFHSEMHTETSSKRTQRIDTSSAWTKKSCTNFSNRTLPSR
jgi:hypothetical protein